MTLPQFPMTKGSLRNAAEADNKRLPEGMSEKLVATGVNMGQE